MQFLSGIFHDQVMASWAQAVIYLFTLFVLIRQARLLTQQAHSQAEAVRLQTEAMRQSEYLRCQIDFTESMRLLIQTGQHSKIYDELANNAGSAFVGWSRYTPEQKSTYAYFEMIYELFERVFVIWKDGWIPDSEWLLWEKWVDDVIAHPLFSEASKDNAGMFDARFEEYINSRLAKLR